MSLRRYLCSDLIVLRRDRRDTMVNLEEIWETGAVVEAEAPVENGLRVELHCGQVRFSGKITRTEKHSFGWRAEVEFSPLTPWSREIYTPAHLLDLSEMQERNRGAGS